MDTKVVIALTGASGALYAKILMEKCKKLIESGQIKALGVIMSDNAKSVWETEIGPFSAENWPFTFWGKDNFYAPFASGSARYNNMVICPCSMGTMARIATGISNDLTTRAADVMLKERRKLILVTRETPLNLIQLNNMKTITEAGGIICPASPSFYSKPQTIEEVCATVIDRVIDLMGLNATTYRWNSVD